MFVKLQRKKLAVTRSDFKLKGRKVCLMPEHQEKTKSQLFELSAERDDIEIVYRFALEFEIIESYRNEHNKPRQRATYLATIREGQLDNVSDCEKFWNKVDDKLKALALSPHETEKLCQDIEAQVARPNAESIKNWRRKWRL